MEEFTQVADDATRDAEMHGHTMQTQASSDDTVVLICLRCHNRLVIGYRPEGSGLGVLSGPIGDCRGTIQGQRP